MLVTQISGGVLSEGRHHAGALARFPHISGPKCPIPSANQRTTPLSPTVGAGAQKRKAKQNPEQTDRHSTTPTQSAAEYREYELIWLMQQRLPAVSWPHWRLCCMQPRGDPSACHASRAFRVLSSCVMCLAPPAVDLLEALRRCVRTRRACCFGSESPLRAPYRSNRWNGGHAIGHRRATESCREQLLQGGTRKRRYFRCNCTDPRRLKALARRTQELLATAPHRYSMLSNYITGQASHQVTRPSKCIISKVTWTCRVGKVGESAGVSPYEMYNRMIQYCFVLCLNTPVNYLAGKGGGGGAGGGYRVPTAG